MRLLMILLRLAIGGLFIFSGIIKAVDPLGFSYKLDEYFNVFEKYSALKWMSADIFANNSLLLASVMCILEVFLGIALILGTWMKLTTLVSLLLMVFFTFLTGFSAITDSVKDCGCFGDAIKLTPWESFMKDVVLTVLLLPVFSYAFKNSPKSSKPLKVITLVGALVSIAIPVYCYLYLPVIDFRPYKEGNNICKLRELPENAKLPIVEMTFIYKNKQTGEEVEFASEDLKNQNLDDFEFIKRYDKVIQEGDVPKIQDFDLFLNDGTSVTEFVLQSKGYKLLLVAYDLGHANTQHLEGFSEIANELSEMGVPSYGLYSINPNNKLAEITAQYGLNFDFFNSDAIPLKTMVRSNPGLVLLQDCNVVKKWPGRSFPSIAEIKAMVQEQEKPSLTEWLLPEMLDLSGNSMKEQLLANGQDKVVVLYGIEAMANEFPSQLVEIVQQNAEYDKQVLLVSEFPEEIPQELIGELEDLGVILVNISEQDVEELFLMNSGVVLTDAKFNVQNAFNVNDYLEE